MQARVICIHQLQFQIMSPFFFALMYIAVCLMYLIYMRKSIEKPNRVIFKALPIGLLFGGTVSFLQDSKVLAIKNMSFLPRVYTLGGGLIFSCLSNVYSEFSSLSVYGMISYAISLGIYIYGFSGSMTLFFDLNINDIVILAAIFIISGIIYLYLLPNLSKLLALFVAVYTILDSLFLSVMILISFKVSFPLLYLGAAGATILYVSDILQAIHLWRRPLPNAQVIIMSLYYMAQLMIAGSVLLVLA